MATKTEAQLAAAVASPFVWVQSPIQEPPPRPPFTDESTGGANGTVVCWERDERHPGPTHEIWVTTNQSPQMVYPTEFVMEKLAARELRQVDAP